MMNVKCSKCGSEKIIPRANIFDQGEGSSGVLTTAVATNPENWVFKGTVYAKLKANICGACGYTEIVAENFAALYDAYLKAKAY